MTRTGKGTAEVLPYLLRRRQDTPHSLTTSKRGGVKRVPRKGGNGKIDKVKNGNCEGRSAGRLTRGSERT